MKRNFIAFFIISIMLVQVFPVTSLLLIAKACQTEQSLENEIEMSMSLQQIDEDEVKTGKLISEHTDWFTYQIIHTEELAQVHFVKDMNLYPKGYSSILIPPPNQSVSSFTL